MSNKSKFKFAFNIFDRDNDGRITVDDILKFMKELKITDWLLTDDCHTITKTLHTKLNGVDITHNNSPSNKSLNFNKSPQLLGFQEKKNSARENSNASGFHENENSPIK